MLKSIADRNRFGRRQRQRPRAPNTRPRPGGAQGCGRSVHRITDGRVHVCCEFEWPRRPVMHAYGRYGPGRSVPLSHWHESLLMISVLARGIQESYGSPAAIS